MHFLGQLSNKKLPNFDFIAALYRKLCKKILDLWVPAAACQACNFRTLSLLLGDPETLWYSVFANLENRLTGERNNN